MSDIFSLIAMMLLALGWDWLGTTRLAAYYTDFDYRYRPLSRSRQIGLAMLVVIGVFAWAIAGSNAPLWVLIPAPILFGIWVITALKDVKAQRRSGRRIAPTYSEGDY